MNDRELMQQALRKMEYMLNNGEWYKPEETIEALRARLAQCDAGEICLGCRACPDAKPQREWQGLTDEEVEQMFTPNYWCDDFAVFEPMVRYIEAKLKEKNT